MDHLDSFNREKGYNLSPTAGSQLGFRHGPEQLAFYTEEWREKQQEGVNKRNASEEFKQAVREGVAKRNQDSRYLVKLKRANKLRDINSGVRTGKALKAIKQHKQGKFK